MSQDGEIFVMDQPLDINFENISKKQETKQKRIKYTIKELKSLANSPLSKKMAPGILDIVM